MTLSNYDILRDIDLRISQLQNTHDRNLSKLQYEFRLFHQETMQSHTGILQRLDRLEAKAEKPLIDLQAIMQNLWFKVAILAALGASNKELLDLVAASLGK